jgi:hypothetical protein
MFGMADLLTVAVINNGLQHLARNPFHLEFILGAFAREPLQSMVGVEHIKQCVDFVTQNRIQVAPYYQLDIKRRPSIGVIAQGREEQQFLGDYGSQQVMNTQESALPPRIYATFDAIAVNSTNDGLLVAPGLKLTEKLWVGQILTNGKVTTRVAGILPSPDGIQPDTVLTKDMLVAPVGLQGWKAQSMERAKGIVLNASQDLVTIQLSLSTTGDMGIHRLFQNVTRYCLKRGRLLFDSYGLQVATFSHTPMVASEPNEPEFESTFTIEARYTDAWIEKEFDLPDSTAKLVVDVDAVPFTTANGEQTVDVSEEPSAKIHQDL